MSGGTSRRVLVLLAALGLFSLGAAAAPVPATHTVTIDSLQFQPDVLTVNAGDSIVWVNTDPFPHTATSKAAPFDSQEIKSGKSWRFIARKTGEFEYICLLHPTMKATLRVK